MTTLSSPPPPPPGLELSFYSGVYGTCIGATAQFGAAAKGLIGISGIVVGVGEIVGEFRLWVQIIGGGVWGGSSEFTTGCSARRRTLRAAVQEQPLQTDLCGVPGDGRPFRGLLPDLPQHARRRAGGLQHRHPEGAVFDPQVAPPPLSPPAAARSGSERVSPLPSVSIALLCSFLLGLGDSCFNTQLYSILGRVYADDSTPAFAIFKFVQVRAESEAPPTSPGNWAAASHQGAVATLRRPSLTNVTAALLLLRRLVLITPLFPAKIRACPVCQSVFAAVAFFYSGYLMLMWQLLLMVVLGFGGTLCFFMVERMQNFSIDLQEH